MAMSKNLRESKRIYCQHFSSIAPHFSFLEELVDHNVRNYSSLEADVVGNDALVADAGRCRCWQMFFLYEPILADVLPGQYGDNLACLFNSYPRVLRPLALFFLHKL
jgi:hypothetical protein